MVARDYRPASGTFTQLDSVQGSAANPLTMNRYLYALANPTTLVDPDGHAAEAACRPDCSPDEEAKERKANNKLYAKNQQNARKREKQKKENPLSDGHGGIIITWRDGIFVGPDGAMIDPQQFDDWSGCGLVAEWNRADDPICSAWWKTYVKQQAVQPEDETLLWASPFALAFASEFVDKRAGMIDEHVIHMRIVAANSGLRGDIPITTTDWYKVGLWDTRAADWMRIGGRTLSIIAIASDFTTGFSHRMELDQGRLLDPRTRGDRAVVQGAITTGAGLAGAGLGLAATASICSTGVGCIILGAILVTAGGWAASDVATKWTDYGFTLIDGG
jgi:hypothetical protein